MFGLSFGLAGLQGALNVGSTMLQNYYNKELAEYQNDKNLEFWHMQNEYNSPSATMNRLVEAGINPRAYQQIGQFANAGQMQPAAVPSKVSELSSFQSVARQGLENELLQEKVKQARYETRAKSYLLQLNQAKEGKLVSEAHNNMMKLIIDGYTNGVDPRYVVGSVGPYGYPTVSLEDFSPGFINSDLAKFSKTGLTTNPYLLALMLGNALKRSGIDLRVLEHKMKSDDYESGVRGSSDGANIVRMIKQLFK